MTKWTMPDEDGNIHIPEEIVDLVDSIARQIHLMIRSGKNEVQTICDIACIAQEYFANAPLQPPREPEKQAALQEAVTDSIEERTRTKT